MENAIETPFEGKTRLTTYLMSNPTLPDDVKERLIHLITHEASGVVVSSEATELIYARADELPVELLEIGAQMATICAGYRLRGMEADNRGFAIAATLRKRPGVTPAPPAPSSLKPPVPSDRYTPEQPEPPVARGNNPSS